ncbi:MAG: RluA family pseudouridine synthase [Treponema sp.]|nr:RluA family pseudouridine synthase [Treponema sp.]
MDFSEFRCGPDDAGRRLDKVLALITGTKTGIYSFLRKNLIKLNNKKAKGDERLCEGDIIKVASFILNECKNNPGTLKNKAAAEKTTGNDAENTAENEHNPSVSVYKNIQLNIIYRNNHLLFINKPKGLCVQPSKDSRVCISSLVKEQFRVQNGSISFTPAPLHRLDRQTSGVLTVSQSLEGAHFFSDCMKNHLLKKIYTGVVCGHLEKDLFLESYITSDEIPVNGFFKVKEDSARKKENLALTRASPLKQGFSGTLPVTLVKFEIETGKKHQIRFQSSQADFPLMGDTVYGGSGSQFLLHCTSMAFPFPNKIEIPEKISAELPRDFDFLLKK